MKPVYPITVVSVLEHFAVTMESSYLSKEFRSYLKSEGIHQKLTVPYSLLKDCIPEGMN